MIREIETEDQKVYRLSGDEFCFITKVKEETISSLIKIQKKKKLFGDIKFLGFSYGSADYPKDGLDVNLLLQHADMNMYHMKNKK